MNELKKRYTEIQNSISRHKKLSKYNLDKNVTLIAVSKGHSFQKIEELYHLGHRDFGENYAQELFEKAEILQKKGCHEIRWHFIGHLQTNKIKLIIPYLYCIHSIDSLKLATKMAELWLKARPNTILPIFIEVKLDQEDSKTGTLTHQVYPLVQTLIHQTPLKIQGLMSIPNPQLNPREQFKQLRELEKQCQPYTEGYLSMGMSSDYPIAIEEGATHIRVGTALFGQRRPKKNFL